MPLPKAPSRPATMLDIREASKAKAARPKTARGGTRKPAGDLETIAAPHLVTPTDAWPLPGMAAAGRPAARGADRPRARLLSEPEAAGLDTEPVDSVQWTPQEPAPRAPVVPLAQPPRARRSLTAGQKLFVLDTNVLMHDPASLFRFQEHDVYLPMMTLEELDNHKRGMSEVSRNARQVSRSLDALIGGGTERIDQGIALAKLGNREAVGRLYLQTQALSTTLPAALPTGKADNQILAVVSGLREVFPSRNVVLVSKDINMRIKAHALGLEAEDYFNDQVTEDLDLLYAGSIALPPDFWDTHSKDMESWQQGGFTYYRLTGPLVPTFSLNQFVYLDGAMPLVAQVRELNGRTTVLQTLRDFAHHKNAIWGITARNREQNFALNLLMNPDIDFVTLLGQAGTGKTLLTLAAGLAQTLDHKRFSEIIMTRATVPVGDDIGYLPGTEEEKMQPWMGALEDNLEVLNQGNTAGGEWGRAAATDLIKSRIRVKAMSFMRGRTFINKFVIIDEAQNLTPKQMKTLATRAGVGSKVVCLGNIAQIDTPYLTEGSSGLTYVVERFKGWAHAGHITLQRGERSRLADYATDVL
ncbi:MAG: PhoH family protein [Lautropia sp.]|nr:PhoH family protein [Lautropia sp.]